MSALPVCRVCLLGNIKMHSIQNTELRELYELLANNELTTEDGRPETVCYICYSQLQRCFKFMQVSRKAEEILTQLFSNGLKVTPEAVSMMNGGIPLISSSTQPTSFYNISYNEELECSLIGSVKLEQEMTYPIEFADDYSQEDVKLDLADDYAGADKGLAAREIKEENMEIHERLNHLNTQSSCIKAEQFITVQPSITETTVCRKMGSLKKSQNGVHFGENPLIAQMGRQNVTNRRTPENVFTCKFCEKILYKKYELLRHLLTHTGNKLNSGCKQLYSDRSVLKRLRVSGVCVKSLPEKIGAKGPMRNTSEKSYSCDVCDKKCTTNRAIKSHMRIHTDKTFACDRCDKTFAVRSYLKKHLKIHSDRARPDSGCACACDRCGKTFYDKSALKKHMRIHTGEKPFVCDRCDKAFAENGNLKLHLRTHTEEKPYACDMCDKSFADRGNLKTHKRVHTGEKPYSCGACGKGFAQSNSLKKHLTTHTGERKFSCTICQKTFAARNGWKIHMRVHSGEKPYACNTCSKSFVDCSTLTRHKRTHTKENPYTCVECNKSFSRKAYLQKHEVVCKRQ